MKEGVEVPPEEVGTEEGDEGEEEADFGSGAGGDGEAPEGEKPDVGEDGDEVADEDVGDRLDQAGASGLAHGWGFSRSMRAFCKRVKHSVVAEMGVG